MLYTLHLPNDGISHSFSVFTTIYSVSSFMGRNSRALYLKSILTRKIGSIGQNLSNEPSPDSLGQLGTELEGKTFVSLVAKFRRESCTDFAQIRYTEVEFIALQHWRAKLSNFSFLLPFFDDFLRFLVHRAINHEPFT